MTATVLRHPAHRRPQQDPRVIALLRAGYRMVNSLWFAPHITVSPQIEWRDLAPFGMSLAEAHAHLTGGPEDAA